jgi:hypothetical protein
MTTPRKKGWRRVGKPNADGYEFRCTSCDHVEPGHFVSCKRGQCVSCKRGRAIIDGLCPNCFMAVHKEAE